MNRHEGVSCDNCMKENFNGRRYKCLICYDYDLCSSCYDARATNTRHNETHAMQCILTRSDFELYFGGEAFTNSEHLLSYTCPYCSRLGFNQTTLQEHITAEHSDISFEVVCPVCAAMPGGEPNLMTDDLVGHLSLTHRPDPRDLICFLDEPHNVRRNLTHLAHFSNRVNQARTRRSNMHFSVFSSRGISSINSTTRESSDPIAELLSQLSVRRTSSNTNTNAPSQLQQLQMHLQYERQQMNATQLERSNTRRPIPSQNNLRDSSNISIVGPASLLPNSLALTQHSAKDVYILKSPSNYLLNGLFEKDSAEASLQQEDKLDRGQFLRELILSTIIRQKPKDQQSDKASILCFFSNYSTSNNKILEDKKELTEEQD